MDSSISSSKTAPGEARGRLAVTAKGLGSRLRLWASWAAALACAVGLWEGLIRLTIESPIPFHHVEGLGWMPAPGSAGLYTDEGASWTRYNEAGFRGGPIAPREPGVLRIACLGDSFTEGQQMSLEATYPAQLGALLNRSPDGLPPGIERVEVFNGGRAHLSPAAVAVLSDGYKRVFDPDVVVLLLRDESLLEAMSSQKEVYLRQKDGAFQPVLSWREGRTSALKRALLDLGLRSSAAAHYAGVRAQLIGAAEKQAGHPPAAGRSRIAELEALARHLLSELKDRYPQVLLVHLPAQPLVGPAASEVSLAEERALRQASAATGVEVVFLRETLAADFRQSQVPAYGFVNTAPGVGHANARAHRLIAQAVRDHLVQAWRTPVAPAAKL